MYVVFDVETTGLPETKGYMKYYDYRNVSKYRTSRIVSIAWVILNENFDEVERHYYIIQPYKFIIPDKATQIHGISQTMAESEGIPFGDVVELFATSISTCNTLVAHNINFDINVLRSELTRFKAFELIKLLNSMTKICTMMFCKESFEMKRAPKLCDMYKMFFDDEMKNAHNALDDALNCAKCFIQLCKRKNDAGCDVLGGDA